MFYAGAMDKPPVLRSDQKLPRGSYFYIQVGHRFYAGEEAETIEVEVDPTDRPALTSYRKDGSWSQQYRERLRNQYWWTSRSRGPRGSRAQRDSRKGSTPTYAKPRPRPEKEIRKEFTGKLNPKLVDTQAQAKQFRRQDRVNSACERLRVCYEGLDVKVSVRYEKGESS